MILLDYVRKTDCEDYLHIPPFHTGHLGLIPETEVSISLQINNSDMGRVAEALITPFDSHFDHLATVNVVMIDQPGVVNKLFRAVAAEGFNIIKQENSSIDRLNNQSVELVVDYRTIPSKFHTLSTPLAELHKYEDIASTIPIRDYKYLRLYQAIFISCADVLVYDNSNGIELPSIRIRPLTNGVIVAGSRTVNIERDKKRKFYVKIKIPSTQLTKIRQTCGYEKNEAVAYIIHSESTTRALRVFFPEKASLHKLFHISFIHNDMPAALSEITEVVREAQFNILTGLLRKKDDNRSGYEVLLEYIGNEKMPDNEDDKMNWILERINGVDKSLLASLGKFEVEITYPEYPIQKARKSYPIIFDESSISISDKKGVNRKKDIDIVFANEMLEKVLLDKNKPSFESKVLHLKKIISSLKQQPVIFLSFASYAKEHANRLKKAIKKTFPDKFLIDEYQQPDLNNIESKVYEKIKSCDFFIAIWHHEFQNSQKEAYGISPWMLYEFGMAKALKKPIIKIHSDKLPKEIWKRIETETAFPSYNDLNFQEGVIEVVIKYIKENW